MPEPDLLCYSVEVELGFRSEIEYEVEYAERRYESKSVSTDLAIWPYGFRKCRIRRDFVISHEVRSDAEYVAYLMIPGKCKVAQARVAVADTGCEHGKKTVDIEFKIRSTPVCAFESYPMHIPPFAVVRDSDFIPMAV